MMAHHSARNSITAMAHTISPLYAGGSVLTDSSTEYPETAKDDPAPTMTDTTDPPAGQAAEAADTHTHKDQYAAEEAALPRNTTTRKAFTSTQLRYRFTKKTSTLTQTNI